MVAVKPPCRDPNRFKCSGATVNSPTHFPSPPLVILICNIQIRWVIDTCYIIYRCQQSAGFALAFFMFFMYDYFGKTYHLSNAIKTWSFGYKFGYLLDHFYTTLWRHCVIFVISAALADALLALYKAEWEILLRRATVMAKVVCMCMRVYMYVGVFKRFHSKSTETNSRVGQCAAFHMCHSLVCFARAVRVCVC